MVSYDPHDWRSHLFDIKGSMVREISSRVTFCMLFAAVVVAAFESGWSVAIPSVGHALIGAFLGLLLVFRTNSSYDRFWEGRKLWGCIVNECRNLARATMAWMPHEPALARSILLWTAAYPWACLNHLRGSKGLGPDADALPPEEAAEVLAAEHVPLAVAGRISRLVAEARRRGVVSDILAVSLDANVQQLVDYIGGCERIHRTPMPFAYMVHLRRALLLYCLTLPFAMVADYGWATLLATLLVAYTFLGIEEIGVEIEDPFGTDENDLPLEDIAEVIRRAVHQLMRTLPEGSHPVNPEVASV